MKKHTISVIIPVYNAESYLDGCIKSFINQTFTDFELILVNDGSTDRSSEICSRAAADDGRIVLIDKKNGGVSSARNAGLDAASGDWIVFADSDDFAQPDCLRVLLEAAINSKADFAVGGFRKLTGNICDDITFPEGTCESSPGALLHLATWGQIFSKAIIDRINLRFDEQLTHSEDALFVIRFAMEARRITHIRGIVYVYRIHPLSACHTANRKGRLQSHMAFVGKLLSLSDGQTDRIKSEIDSIASTVIKSGIGAFAADRLCLSDLREGWRQAHATCSRLAPGPVTYLFVCLRARIRTIKKKLLSK